MFAIAVLAALATLPPPAGDTEGVAAAARAVLKKHCAACHVGPGSENGYRFNALDAASMLKAYGPDEPAVLAPRDLGSRVYARAAVEKTMPPRATKERPSRAELDALKRWVEAGAPAFPAPLARPHLSVTSQLDAVATHLAAAEAGRRPFLRYFTLTHLHNDTAVGEDDLRTARAALAKAVNSLSRLPLVALAAVDPDQTVFALDLRDVGWQDFRAWRAVLKQYPYGLNYRGGDDAGLRAAQERLDGLSGGGLVAVRADWFVATATRPPLYETLLRLPDTAAGLRAELGIDLAKNFRENTLRRAGLFASGVSGQNRLVERQDTPSGYYWESYDFKPRRARGSLRRS